jgi:drug/metabolite transporter (DMT)-like permease
MQQPSASVPVIPVLLLMGAAACAAEATVVVKQFPQSHPIATNALALTFGALMLLALSLLTGEPWRLPSLTATWGAILYLVTIGSVALFYVFLFVVRRWTASAASYQFVLFPFVSIAVAAWLLSEAVTLPIVLGGALVLAGVWLGALYQGKRPTEDMRVPTGNEPPLPIGEEG